MKRLLLSSIPILALTLAAGCAAQTTQMEPCPATGCAPEPTATATTTPYYRTLESLAVQDLQCPANELHYYFIPNAGDAVEGCGKKALYLRVCSESDPFHLDCHPERARDWS